MKSLEPAGVQSHGLTLFQLFYVVNVLRLFYSVCSFFFFCCSSVRNFVNCAAAFVKTHLRKKVISDLDKMIKPRIK